MPLTIKTIIAIITTILITSSFSGCIFDDILGITTLSLVSWTIIDDEDFASLNITFESSGTSTFKLLGSNSQVLDSEYFYKENDNQYALLHLAESRHSVTSGSYYVKAYNIDNSEIYSKIISFDGADLSISSCYQKWWERETWIGGFSLLELRLIVQNNGDVPTYPYYVKVTVDTETTTGLVIPCVIMPGETDYVYCFIYIKSEPDESDFSIYLEDIDENILTSGVFPVDIQDNIALQKFEWKHQRNDYWVYVPKTTYLNKFYSGLDRINIEDYSLYIFNQYDDQFIDILLDILMFSFSSTRDVDIINYIASFVQKGLQYERDSETNESYEYPRYPVETLFYGKGDCEDLSIILASLLDRLGYSVALLRLPNHMAVGVQLEEDELPYYDYYIEDYYFLETTTTTPSCGYVPSSYQSPSELSIYPITSRPLLIHNWKEGHLSIYSINGKANSIKVTLVIENLGVSTAQNVLVKAAFYSNHDQEINAISETISSLEPGMKEEVTIICNVPLSVTTWFKTRVYYDNVLVDEHQSISSFP
jgi:predicted transglutaminase-like cysteine proteinase